MSGPQLPGLALVREPTDEGYLDREGVRLHWLEWAPSGTPEPPAILLLHGLSSNARYRERVARRMTNRRLVALDQRSHGLPDAPPTGYGVDVLAADAGHAIREGGRADFFLVHGDPLSDPSALWRVWRVAWAGR